MNPNHYLAVAISYLFANRPGWPATAGIGKTLVSSSMIDRVAKKLVPARSSRCPWASSGSSMACSAALSALAARRAPARRSCARMASCGRRTRTVRSSPARGGDHREDRSRSGEHYAALTEESARPLRTHRRTRERRAESDPQGALARAGARHGSRRRADHAHAHHRARQWRVHWRPQGRERIGLVRRAAVPARRTLYKIYAESFRDADHLHRIQAEAQEMLAKSLRDATVIDSRWRRRWPSRPSICPSSKNDRSDVASVRGSRGRRDPPEQPRSATTTCGITTRRAPAARHESRAVSARLSGARSARILRGVAIWRLNLFVRAGRSRPSPNFHERAAAEDGPAIHRRDAHLGRWHARRRHAHAPMQWRTWMLATAGKFFRGSRDFHDGRGVAAHRDGVSPRDAEKGLVSAASLFGILIGATALGGLRDRFRGRKAMFIAGDGDFRAFLVVVTWSPASDGCSSACSDLAWRWLRLPHGASLISESNP